MTVAELLRSQLDRLDLTQRDAARELRVTPKHVNAMLQGRALPSPGLCRRLETLTGVPSEHWWLMVGEAKWQRD